MAEESASTSELLSVHPIVPSERKPRLPYIAASVILVIFGLIGGVWLYNEVTVEKALQHVIVADPRNQSVQARAHYDGWIDLNSVVFDISDVSPKASRMDVFRCFLQYAEAMKERRFKRVVLAARGKKKWFCTRIW